VSKQLGKVLYGALFTVVLPTLLWGWARATRGIVTIAMPPAAFGWALSAVGFSMTLAGIVALAIWGRGLPMNAYPPPRLVTRGPFALFANPIYVGFCAACAGASIAAASASGLYLVTPTMILCSAALVLGYEGPALRARFGPRPTPLFAFARDEDGPPSRRERIIAYAIAIVPWCVLYEGIARMGRPPDAFTLALPGEEAWPVIEQAEIAYISIYPAVLALPLLVRTRRALRRFEIDVVIAMALIFPLYLALPIASIPRSFEPDGVLGRLLFFERALDTPLEAFPSFHVVLAFLVARALKRPAAYAWAAIVSAACIATGMHTALDVVAGLFASLVVIRAASIASAARNATERIANSWREWHFGPVRVIHHGLFAGLGTAGALVIVGAFVGPGHSTLVVTTALAGLLGAGAWAQLVEGSAVLMRPYGFYGGVLGIIVAAFAAPWFGVSTWHALAAYALAGPFVQSMGRLRCLVQGCCHGAPCSPSWGIVYRHPRSRVVKLAELGGVPVHPTPLYSIAWNAVVALVVVRLAILGVPASFLAGVYLGLTGIGRFVEEAYRGEPQTPTFGGLRLYQWIAIATIVAGAAVTSAPSTPLGPPAIDAAGIVVALGAGVVVAVALGVDFPSSNRRFSRLA
jgi:protein-S-isoprenylcysteine O-methyltransferase Ste14